MYKMLQKCCTLRLTFPEIVPKIAQTHSSKTKPSGIRHFGRRIRSSHHRQSRPSAGRPLAQVHWFSAQEDLPAIAFSILYVQQRMYLDFWGKFRDENSLALQISTNAKTKKDVLKGLNVNH